MKKIRNNFVVILALIVILAVPVNANSELGPVNSKDVIYQVITDRFYDGDSSNNIVNNAEIFDDQNNDGKGDGTDLKLYQGGDFQGIIEKIPYLKGMGITAVWISAPYENRDEAIIDYQADGSQDIWSSFHGYHARNYFATNKHFGSMKKFEDLSKKLNENGIKLVIDFVTNHSSRWQNPTNNFSAEDGKLYEPDKDLFGNYCFDADKEPYDYNGDGIVENLVGDPNNDVKGFFHGLGDRAGDKSKFGFRNKELGSLADYSQENPEVVNFLQKSMKFWIDKGLNGIRHDATLHMNPAFVKDIKDSIDSNENGPLAHFGEFFIGRPDPKYGEYTSFPTRTGVNNLDFEFFRTITSTFGDFSTSMSDFANMLTYTSNDYMYENQAVTFIDNHDVSRFGYHQKREEVFNAAIVALMVSRGTPNIYYGTEQYIKPDVSSDVGGRVFMEKETSFDTNTSAYRIIKKLSDLRQYNNALAYGMTKILYSNQDVLIMERKFYDEVVLIVINRQPDKSITVNRNVRSDFYSGIYNDVLDGEMNAGTLNVNGNGDIYFDSIPAGYAGVWSFIGNSNENIPVIGNVVSTMGRAGNKVFIYGKNFDSNDTKVEFGGVNGEIISITDDYIETVVPTGITGEINIKVIKSGIYSNGFRYNILSGNQVQVIFHANASTAYGETLHVVGNIPELGNWDTNKSSEAMMNPSYPNWFLPVSVPENTNLEFKFIKKDTNGNVIWESGSNRYFTSPSNDSAILDTGIYYCNF